MNYELRVNPIACDAHGVCAELLPEIIELDSWGHPIVMAAGVPADLVEHAKRAAGACPVRAPALVTRSRG
jgi:ferredoxin